MLFGFLSVSFLFIILPNLELACCVTSLSTVVDDCFIEEDALYYLFFFHLFSCPIHQMRVCVCVDWWLCLFLIFMSFSRFYLFILISFLFLFATANIFSFFSLKKKQTHEIVVSSRSPPRPGYTLKSSTLPVNGRQNGGDYLVIFF
jgi:hypothetical protein